MESLLYFIVYTLFITSVEAMPTGTYEDIKHAVSNGLPWVNPMDPKIPCATNLCQDFQKLCKNGGQCEMTPECGAKCRCLKKYTGPFCGVKVKDTVTNGKFELLRATKTPDLNKKTNTTTESASSSSQNPTVTGTTESILQSTTTSQTSRNVATELNSSTSDSSSTDSVIERSSAVVKNKRSVTGVTETVNSTGIMPVKNYKILKKWMSILDKLRVG